MKPLKDYMVNESSTGAQSLKNKTYKSREGDGIITYDTTIVIKGDAVNIQGHPSAETIDTVTTSDFWIPNQEFASILAKILANPAQGFEQAVKPAPGGDSRFKKIWISYQPVRWQDIGRIGLFQSEKGARYGSYGDPSQMWTINLEDFEKIFKDNPNLQ